MCLRLSTRGGRRAPALRQSVRIAYPSPRLHLALGMSVRLRGRRGHDFLGKDRTMPYATANGVRLFYEQLGDGEPIVLIPGLGLDHTYFRYAIPELSKHFRVIAYDQRGTGQSDRPQEAYTARLWADDLEGLLASLGIGQAHVVGSSLGGCVALELLRSAPHLAKTLILVAAFSELDRALETNFRMRIAMVEQGGMGGIIRDHVLLWTLWREFIETDRGKQAAEGLLAGLSKNDPKLYAEFLTWKIHERLELKRRDDG